VVAIAPCDGNLYLHRIGGNDILDDGCDVGDFDQWTAVVP